jgi:predicted nucleic acid-binding protein
MTAPDPALAPAVVLDTNAVLDWLVFRHPACADWTRRFADRSARWIASAAMRTELAHVLGRPVLDAWCPEPAAVWDSWDRLAEILDPSPAAPVAGRPRCTDPDDQKFVDLALAHGARWLVSRDRAVLKLGRRTRSLGLEVLTPDAWAVSFPAG